MLKVIIILALVWAGYYVQNTYDFSRFKEEAINTMQKEKTINMVNSSRANEQNDILDATNR